MISPNLIREILFILLRVSCQVVRHYCIHNTLNSISNTFITRQNIVMEHDLFLMGGFRNAGFLTDFITNG